jgi:hypothetical protein
MFMRQPHAPDPHPPICDAGSERPADAPTMPGLDNRFVRFAL